MLGSKTDFVYRKDMALLRLCILTDPRTRALLRLGFACGCYVVASHVVERYGIVNGVDVYKYRCKIAL